jgi:hypothetical protein
MKNEFLSKHINFLDKIVVAELIEFMVKLIVLSGNTILITLRCIRIFIFLY